MSALWSSGIILDSDDFYLSYTMRTNRVWIRVDAQIPRPLGSDAQCPPQALQTRRVATGRASGIKAWPKHCADHNPIGINRMVNIVTLNLTSSLSLFENRFTNIPGVQRWITAILLDKYYSIWNLLVWKDWFVYKTYFISSFLINTGALWFRTEKYSVRFAYTRRRETCKSCRSRTASRHESVAWYESF